MKQAKNYLAKDFGLDKNQYNEETNEYRRSIIKTIRFSPAELKLIKSRFGDMPFSAIIKDLLFGSYTQQ